MISQRKRSALGAAEAKDTQARRAEEKLMARPVSGARQTFESAAQIRERAASHLKKPAARSAGFGASCTDPVDGTKSEVGGRDRSTPTCAQVSQFCGGSRGAKGGYHA
jgi:hypothetical protein